MPNVTKNRHNRDVLRKNIKETQIENHGKKTVDELT